MPRNANEHPWVPVGNDRNAFSVWRADRPLPAGWFACGPPGGREDALKAIAAQPFRSPVPGPPDMLPIDQRIAAAAVLAPDRLAVSGSPGEVTYTQLIERSTRLRAGLEQRGVVPGTVVALCLSRGPDMLAVITAVLAAGAAYLPLDPRYPAERLAYIIRDAGAVCVVAEGPHSAPLSVDVAVLTPDELSVDGRVAEEPSRSRIDDLAYVMYTSGSTGSPKGVEVTHRNVAGMLDAMVALLPSGAAQRVLFSTRYAFDISVLEMQLPLTTGGTCVIAAETWVPRPRMLCELIAASHPTLVQSTPVGWRMLLAAGVRLDADQTVLVGGDVLPADLAGQLASMPAPAFNMYGPTEATVWATAAPITSARATIGSALAHCTAYVLDEGEPVAGGDYGELFLGGPAVARGYRGAPALTADRFVPDPFAAEPGARMYATGDIVRAGPDGLEFAHRRDTQVKINGVRVELGEIETLAAQQDEVTAAVAVIAAGPGDPVLTLYLEGDEGAAEAVRLRLERFLPPIMVPQRIVVLAALPVTSNGKVDRTALTQAGGDG